MRQDIQTKLTITFFSFYTLILLHFYQYHQLTCVYNQNSKNLTPHRSKYEEYADKKYALSHTSHSSAMYDLSSFDENNKYSTRQYICCYRDPNHFEDHVGRPFPVTDYIIDVYEQYMAAKALTHDDKKDIAMPQPVTAFSSNHYKEHLKEIGTAMRLFKGMQIVVYDLGMSAEQKTYIQNNSTFIYSAFFYFW